MHWLYFVKTPLGTCHKDHCTPYIIYGYVLMILLLQGMVFLTRLNWQPDSIVLLIFLILCLINHSSMDWYLACFKFCKHCSVNIPAHRPKWTYVSTPVRRVSGGEIAESEFACCYFIKNILIMLKPPSKCCWFTLPQPEDTIYYYKLFQFAFALVLMRTSIFSQVKWLNFSFWPTFLLDCFFLLIYKRSP
jgi:hypothetical protein